MTTLAASAKGSFLDGVSYLRQLGAAKLLLLIALTGLLIGTSPETRGIIFASLADAYLAVSVFVAATLGAIYYLEHKLDVDVAGLLRKYHRWQVPVAAALGALPGCGGAVAVVTQYVRGSISFGSLVAVLAATMGDAAFLLLAAEPTTGLLVFVLGFVVGSITGHVIDWIHGVDFLRADHPELPDQVARKPLPRLNKLRPVWAILLVPGLLLGILDLLQVDTDALFGPLAAFGPTEIIGVTGALLAFAMWTLDPELRFDPGVSRAGGAFTRTVDATNFVTVWVIVGFLVYELGVHFSGIDLAQLFDTYAPLIPLLAVLVGFLPGCGPQIVVTSLYITGAMPLSGQLANAISNDGDALFPALAIAPKAAAVATIYSGIPALIVGYGTYLFWG
ncbi:putative manganese transporter [Rhodovibrio sodomensis]|uniref:putative manganese transporter n=1 Tax=Rhodovibrio sodomensis TaxID=1088 RepID=UPI001904D173